MVKKSNIHYYLDGDILIFADNTYFRVHKLVLRMASPTLLSKQEKRENDLPLINIPDEFASTIDIALSIIYPCYFIMPTWTNVDALLRLASNYAINKVCVASVSFLDQNFKQNPMYTFYLADKYKLSFLFKETSKLILDRFPEYKNEKMFKNLPPEAQSALEKRYLNFIHSIARLSIKYFVSSYKHRCNDAASHNKELAEEIKSRIVTILNKPITSPSTVWNIMHSYITVDDYTDCNKYFMNEHFNKKFKTFFGNFKCLDVESHETNPKHYIYIKRKEKY